MMKPVRFALPKGRLFDQALILLAKTGIQPGPGQEESRKLLYRDTSSRFEFVPLKPIDIPVYVESGAIDVGIVGSDILRELESDVYEPMDLQIGRCRLSLAVPDGKTLSYDQHLRVATKYPRTAARFFAAKNSHVHVVKLDGSVEIAPLLGLADAIVDLVETGRTLRENGMHIVEDIAQISAKFIVNRTAMKMKAKAIRQLISQLDATVYENT